MATCSFFVPEGTVEQVRPGAAAWPGVSGFHAGRITDETSDPGAEPCPHSWLPLQPPSSHPQPCSRHCFPHANVSGIIKLFLETPTTIKKSVSFFPHSSYENVIHLTPTARQQSLPRDLASLRAQHPPCYTWFPVGAVLCPQHPTVTMDAELGSWFPRLSASVPKVFSILDEVQSSNHCHIFSCTNSELHIEGSNSHDMDTN